MASAIKRLTRDLSDLSLSEYKFCSAKPISDNIFHLDAKLYPPITSPYYGNIYTLELLIPEEYPFKPPKARFITPIVNDYVHPRNGYICLDVLDKGWVPSLTIGDLLGRICGILY